MLGNSFFFFAEKQKSPVYQLVSELKPELQVPALSVSRDNLFVQWQNLDAMCWMDVVLIMLVYSPTLRPLVNMDPGHELASTLLITLLKANRQAQVRYFLIYFEFYKLSNFFYL